MVIFLMKQVNIDLCSIFFTKYKNDFILTNRNLKMNQQYDEEALLYAIGRIKHNFVKLVHHIGECGLHDSFRSCYICSKNICPKIISEFKKLSNCKFESDNTILWRFRESYEGLAAKWRTSMPTLIICCFFPIFRNIKYRLTKYIIYESNLMGLDNVRWICRSHHGK